MVWFYLFNRKQMNTEDIAQWSVLLMVSCVVTLEYTSFSWSITRAKQLGNGDRMSLLSFCWPSLCMIKQQGSEWPTNLRESMCQIAYMCVWFLFCVCLCVCAHNWTSVCIYLYDFSEMTQIWLHRVLFCTKLPLKHRCSAIRSSLLKGTPLKPSS